MMGGRLRLGGNCRGFAFDRKSGGIEERRIYGRTRWGSTSKVGIGIWDKLAAIKLSERAEESLAPHGIGLPTATTRSESVAMKMIAS